MTIKIRTFYPPRRSGACQRSSQEATAETRLSPHPKRYTSVHRRAAEQGGRLVQRTRGTFSTA